MSSNALLARAIHSLRNTNNPTFCCKYYIIAARRSMRFHHRQPVSDMAVFARRMEHCECDRNACLIDFMNAREWNLTAYCRDLDGFLCRTDTLEGLLAVIADVLYNALQLHDHRSLRWPQNRRQCLFGSDEGAATMLCRRLGVYPILPLLRAIATAAASFGPAVLIPFLSAHIYPRIWWAF
jgi:hypothetical protein